MSRNALHMDLPKRPNRRSIRLKGYDYSRSGAYFITICAQNRECLFGEIENGKMILSDAGRVVVETWEWLSLQYDHVELDIWAVMPNHLHGIIVILDDGRGGSRTDPTGKRKPIGRLIGAFKTVSSKRINEMCKTPGAKIWQRNYYEHIIRNEKDLETAREYIMNNLKKWELDRENPKFHKKYRRNL